MRLVRIGLGSIDTTVGAFRENADRAIAMAREMACDGATVGVLPEQAIGGYPVEDLIQWQGFVDRQWGELERFARETANLECVFIIGVSVLHQGLRYNCAATVAGGAIWALTPKEKLPTYNIFYEGRTLSGVRPAPSRPPMAFPLATSSSASISAQSPRRSARTSGARTAPPNGGPTPAPSWSAMSPPRPSGSASCRLAAN